MSPFVPEKLADGAGEHPLGRSAQPARPETLNRSELWRGGLVVPAPLNPDWNKVTDSASSVNSASCYGSVRQIHAATATLAVCGPRSSCWRLKKFLALKCSQDPRIPA